MTIHIFNPRSIIREGARKLLESASNPENTVIFRGGPHHVGGRRVIISKHSFSTKALGEDIMGRAFKLVELTPEEIQQLQKQLDEETEAESEE